MSRLRSFETATFLNIVGKYHPFLLGFNHLFAYELNFNNLELQCQNSEVSLEIILPANAYICNVFSSTKVKSWEIIMIILLEYLYFQSFNDLENEVKVAKRKLLHYNIGLAIKGNPKKNSKEKHVILSPIEIKQIPYSFE